jgi:hypothetical protein
MDKVQKHILFNTNTPSSESYKRVITFSKCKYSVKRIFVFNLLYKFVNSLGSCGLTR